MGGGEDGFPCPTSFTTARVGLDEREQLAHAQTLERLERFGIPHFNPDFGDKIDVYHLLLASESVAAHLPETLPLTAENLKDLGARYSTLYIKPSRGRQGKGIRKCRRLKEGWSLMKTAAKGRVIRTLPTEEAIVAACARLKSGERYLVQRGLDLIRFAGGTVDIRVITQRDRLGDWRVSAIGVRAGRPGGLVSNLHAGGRAITLTKLVRGARLKQSVSRLSERIKVVALAAATAMSSRYPTVGELGIDIGLDTQGHIWILEVNRQPGRALFSRARLKRACAAPACAWLSSRGFSPPVKSGPYR